MKYSSILVVVFSLFLIVSCKQKESYKKINEEVKEEVKVTSPSNSSVHKIVIKEAVDGGSYSYLKVKEDNKEYWMAVSKVDAKVGETYYYDKGMTMRNFESKYLKKTFDEIVFADTVRKTEKGVEKKPHTHAKKESKLDKMNIKLSKSGNDIYLKDLFENKSEYAGEEIEVSGVVVKVNKKILDRNWIHIVDGTKTDAKSSLTITSTELAKVGDTITFKGKIVLDKDFGYNYVYDILLEDGKILK